MTVNAEPAKPLRSILKNKRRLSGEPAILTATLTAIGSTSKLGQEFTKETIPAKVPKVEVGSSTVSSVMTSNDATSSEMETMDQSQDNSSIQLPELPAGFFDDPKLDAKARNVEFVDPIEKEFQEFQKIIQQVSMLLV